MLEGNFFTLDCYYSTNATKSRQPTELIQLPQFSNSTQPTKITQFTPQTFHISSKYFHTTSPDVLVIDVVIPCCKNIPRVDNQLTVHGIESLQFSHELDGEAPDSTCGQFGFPFAIIFHSGCP